MLEIREIKGKDLKNWVKSELDSFDNNSGYYDNKDLYQLQWTLKNIKDDEKYFVVVDGDEVFDILFFEELFGISICYPSWYHGNHNLEELKTIISKFNSSMIDLGEYCNFDLEELNMCLVDMSMNLSQENERYHYSGTLACIKTFKNVLKEAFEKYFYIDNFELSEVDIKVLKESQIQTILKNQRISIFDIPSTINDSNHHQFAGFHYFSWDNLGQANYLTALIDNKIVGIIKIGEYGEGCYYRQSINYIDIRKDCKNKGLASLMISKLDNFLNPNLPLVVTDESDEGKKCHIFEHFKNNIHKVPVYGYYEFFEKSHK